MIFKRYVSSCKASKYASDASMRALNVGIGKYLMLKQILQFSATKLLPMLSHKNQVCYEDLLLFDSCIAKYGTKLTNVVNKRACHFFNPRQVIMNDPSLCIERVNSDHR